MNITDDLAGPVQLQLERTVRELEQEAAEWKLTASELELESDEAKESVSTSRLEY